MDSQQIKKSIADLDVYFKALEGTGGLRNQAYRDAVSIRAALETAFQLAKLNEAIESGATIIIQPKDGRKFRA